MASMLDLTLTVVVVACALGAQWWARARLRGHDAIAVSRLPTGLATARLLLDAAGCGGVAVRAATRDRIRRDGSVELGEQHADRYSVAAVAVGARLAGQAALWSRPAARWAWAFARAAARIAGVASVVVVVVTRAGAALPVIAPATLLAVLLALVVTGAVIELAGRRRIDAAELRAAVPASLTGDLASASLAATTLGIAEIAFPYLPPPRWPAGFPGAGSGSGGADGTGAGGYHYGHGGHHGGHDGGGDHGGGGAW